jgi:hypothetical protein
MKNRHLYPKDWKRISSQCRERAGGKCEFCKIENGAERLSRKGKPYKVALAACHKNHDERYSPEADLLCLCEICHWWHDFEIWLLEQWRNLERAKHLKLLTPERIAQARARACQRARMKAA